MWRVRYDDNLLNLQAEDVPSVAVQRRIAPKTDCRRNRISAFISDKDNYVFADNREFYVGPGDDNLWGNDDDEKSVVLPAAGVIDIRVAYLLDVMSGLNVSLNINNLLDTQYWQSGSEYGTAPGAARTVMLNLGVGL